MKMGVLSRIQTYTHYYVTSVGFSDRGSFDKALSIMILKVLLSREEFKRGCYFTGKTSKEIILHLIF
jgi:hypothetical protein